MSGLTIWRWRSMIRSLLSEKCLCALGSATFSTLHPISGLMTWKLTPTSRSILYKKYMTKQLFRIAVFTGRLSCASTLANASGMTFPWTSAIWHLWLRRLYWASGEVMFWCGRYRQHQCHLGRPKRHLQPRPLRRFYRERPRATPTDASWGFFFRERPQGHHLRCSTFNSGHYLHVARLGVREDWRACCFIWAYVYIYNI